MQNEMKEIAANSDSVNTSQEDIFLKVLGGPRSGHVRGKGCGAIPTRSISSSTHPYHNYDECLAKQLENEKKLATVKAEMKESKATQAIMQAQLERLLNHIGG
jgi:hypothetical protein